MQKLWLIGSFFVFLLMAGMVSATTYTCNSCSTCNTAISGAIAGDTIQLTASIVDSIASPQCITFNKAVNFDCQGRTIDGVDGSNRYAFLLYGFTGGSISNCVLTDWYRGIYTSGSFSALSINNITATSNVYAGLYFENGGGMSINNVISSNNGYYGIAFASAANDGSVTNTVVNNNQIGIYTLGSGKTFNNVTAVNNSLYGIQQQTQPVAMISNSNLSENGLYDWYPVITSDSSCGSSSTYFTNVNGSGNRPIIYSKPLTFINITNQVASEIVICNADVGGISYITNVTVIGSATRKNNGILIYRTDNARITNVNSSYRNSGILIDSASAGNILTNVTASYNLNNGVTINGANARVSGLTANGNNDGVSIIGANAIITNSYISGSGSRGLYITGANVSVYNNTLNNVVDFYSTSTTTNIGNNYWLTPSGTGYSELCANRDGDQYCDFPYYANGTGNVDYFVLTANTPKYFPITMYSPQNTTYVNEFVPVQWSFPGIPIEAYYSLNGNPSIALLNTSVTIGSYTGNKLYVVCDSSFQCKVNGSIGYSDGILYLPVQDRNKVYAMDATTGSQLFSWSVTSPSGVTVVGDKVWVTTNTAKTNCPYYKANGTSAGSCITTPTPPTAGFNGVCSDGTLFYYTSPIYATAVTQYVNGSASSITIPLSPATSVYSCTVVGDYIYFMDYTNSRALRFDKNTLTYTGFSFLMNQSVATNPTAVGFDGRYFYIQSPTTDPFYLHKYNAIQSALNKTLTATIGSNTVQFTVKTASAINTTSVSFTYANLPPVITIDAPENRTYGTNYIWINATANEGISTWKYSLNGGDNQTFSGNVLLNLTDNDYNLVVYGTSSLSGLTGSAFLSFRVDASLPTIGILYPTAGLRVNSADVEVSGVGENNFLIAVWTDNESAWGTNLGSLTNWRFRYSSIPEGSHSVTVFINDSAGHENNDTVSFVVDRTLPTISITSPTEGGIYTAFSDIDLDVSANEPVTSSWVYNIDGGINQSFSPNMTFQMSSGGLHSVTIYVTDIAGNTGSAIANFKVKPTISVSSPEARLYGTPHILLTGVTDVAVDTWMYSLDSGANVTFVSGVSTLELAENGSDDGNHNIVFFANVSGVFGESSPVTFDLDTIQPLVIVTSPSNGTRTNVMDMELIGVSENLHINTTWVNDLAWGDNLGTTTPPLINWLFRYYNIPEGNYLVDVYTNDSASLIGSKTISFTVDRTLPVISITSPADGNSYDAFSIVNLDVSANEGVNSGLWYYKINGGASVPFTPNTTLDFTMEAGIYNLTVYAIDLANNEGNKTIQFTVNQVASHPVSQPETLVVSNVIYIVQNNITSVGEPVFIVNANNVTIECNNKYLVADPPFNVIIVNGEHTTIQNCTIQSTSPSSGDAILLYSDNNVLKNVMISGMSDGLVATDSYYNTLNNVRIANSRHFGIYIDQSGYNTMNGLTLTGNANGGLLILNSMNDSISNVVASNNTNGVSIGISGAIATGFTLDNVTVSSDSVSGMMLVGDYFVVKNSKVIEPLVSGYALSLDCRDHLVCDNLLYNNYFNISGSIYGDHVFIKAYPESEPSYRFNTLIQMGTRIFGDGQLIGGNYWDGRSFSNYSQICDDADGDGLCDNPFLLGDISGVGYPAGMDEYPLSNDGQSVTCNATQYYDSVDKVCREGGIQIDQGKYKEDNKKFRFWISSATISNWGTTDPTRWDRTNQALPVMLDIQYIKKDRLLIINESNAGSVLVNFSKLNKHLFDDIYVDIKVKKSFTLQVSGDGIDDFYLIGIPRPTAVYKDAIPYTAWAYLPGVTEKDGTLVLEGVHMSESEFEMEFGAGFTTTLGDAGNGLGNFLNAITNPIVGLVLGLGIVGGVLAILFGLSSAIRKAVGGAVQSIR